MNKRAINTDSKILTSKEWFIKAACFDILKIQIINFIYNVWVFRLY